MARQKMTEVNKKLLLTRSAAYTEYYKARLALAEAHSKLVEQAIKENTLDGGIIDVQYR